MMALLGVAVVLLLLLPQADKTKAERISARRNGNDDMIRAVQQETRKNPAIFR